MKNPVKNLFLSLICIGTLVAGEASWAHGERVREKPVGRGWVGVGGGVAGASVDLECTPPATGDCDESGTFGTYSANVTLSGRHGGALRVRGVRAADSEGGARTPYETAALIGTRFGRSNWYGLVGAGRILHADNEFEGDAHGFAWEVLFAPASRGPVGFELSFLGNAGEDVDFVAFNTGLRFGSMR